MTPTFVLIHGSNSNSFAFAPLQRELALLGHRSLAVDLPGHGFDAAFADSYQAPQDTAAFAGAPSVLGEKSMADNVEHLAATLRRVREHGPAIVLAHSRGGFALTALGNAMPELIDRMVYMSAWCCVADTPGAYAASPENAKSVLAEAAVATVAAGDPAALGLIRMNWRTGDSESLEALHRSMLADGPRARFLAFLNTLEPDESLDFGGDTVLADAATWGRIPRSYIRLTEDLSVPIALQDRFIAEADAIVPGNPFDVHTLTTSHVGPLVEPRDLAAILDTFAH